MLRKFITGFAVTATLLVVVALLLVAIAWLTNEYGIVIGFIVLVVLCSAFAGVMVAGTPDED